MLDRVFVRRDAETGEVAAQAVLHADDHCLPIVVALATGAGAVAVDLETAQVLVEMGHQTCPLCVQEGGRI